MKIKRKLKLRNIIVIILVLVIISVIIIFNFLNSKANPVLITYADSQTKKLSTIVINSAISNQLKQNITVDNIFQISKDSQGNISSINFNSIVVNNFLTQTTNSVELSLKYIETGQIDKLEIPDDVLKSYNKDNLKKGIIYEVPLGVIFNNSILTNILPKIPVKLNLVGSIVSEIKTKITNYGINNALIEVYINLKTDIRVILPFVSNKITVKTSVPVAIKIIQGTVPNYYANGLTSPSLSIPIE